MRSPARRLFVAIDLDDAARVAIAVLQQHVVHALGAARSLTIVDSARMHLTLAFLGEIPDPEKTERELKMAVAFVEEQTASYQAEQRADARQLALGDFCQVLLGLNEFIYVD